MRTERSHLMGVARTPAGPLRLETEGLARLWRIVQEVNPSRNRLNCAHTTDTVVHRLTGANASGVSHHDGNGGDFAAIAARHGTSFTWNHSLDAIYDIVRSGGHGTIALVGILWWPSFFGSHIVAMGNVDGVVGICEGQRGGQEPPEVVSDRDRARKRYQPLGREIHGLAMVRWGCPFRGGWEGSHTDPRMVQPRSHRQTR